jgi:hypothetical protein
MAVASLTVAAGAIAAETGGVATAAMVAAGTTLTKGAITMLSSNTPKTVPIFDPYQVQVDLSAPFTGTEKYVLLHKGDPSVKAADLSIVVNADSGEALEHKGVFFDDGAWILFRIRKSEVYSGDPRPWYQEREDVKNSIEDVIERWKAKGATKEDVSIGLVPTGKEPATVGDKYVSICHRIRADLVLTTKDRIAAVGDVGTYYSAAQAAVEANDPDKFYELRDKTITNLKNGAAPPEQIAAFYRDEVASLLTAGGEKTSLAALHEEKLWESLRIE